MIIEDSLEELATCYLRLAQKFDPTHLEVPVAPGKPQTQEIILKQIPESFLVKVDGHSNSPVFNDDQTQLVFTLLKANLITRRRALEMLPIPMRQLLIHDLLAE